MPLARCEWMTAEEQNEFLRDWADKIKRMDPMGWQVANDPQPIATGEGGTPWPLLGDQFSQKLRRPIGFVSVGWGGTTVNQWQPSIQDGLYSRLRAVLKQLQPNGLRAILWHQGESDTILGTSSDEYANRMEKVIRQSEMDIGQSVSWFIAEVSYIGPDHQHKQAEIINGQKEKNHGC